MTLLTIDQDKCKQDGLCAADCPMSIIGWQPKSYPEAVNGAEQLCINCGHCVAICPHGAIALKDLSPEDCLDFNPALALSAEQTEQFLRSRRSIRNFKEKPVEKDLIARAIKLASYAPSGHNLQPVRWQVVDGRDKVRDLAGLVADWMKQMIIEKPDLAKLMHFELLAAAWDMGMDVITRNAPHLVLVNAAANDRTAPAACTIAMTYFDLAAQSLGIGTCWCGFVHMGILSHPPVKEALGLGDDLQNLGVMMVGAPKFSYARMPERNAPRITWI